MGQAGIGGPLFRTSAEPAAQLSARDAGFVELPIMLDLEHRQGGQAHKVRPALMTLGNLVTPSGRQRFLDRAAAP
jgi:hypothetical protein